MGWVSLFNVLCFARSVSARDVLTHCMGLRRVVFNVLCFARSVSARDVLTDGFRSVQHVSRPHLQPVEHLLPALPDQHLHPGARPDLLHRLSR